MSIFNSMLGFLGNTTRAVAGLSNPGDKDYEKDPKDSKNPEIKKLNAVVREETKKTAKKLLEKFDKQTINNFVSGKTKGSEKEYASNKNKDVKSKNNTASKIKPLPQGGDMIDMLNKIYSFLKTNSEEDKLHQDRLNNYMEENLAEAKARHDKLLEAIKKLMNDVNVVKEEVQTATPPVKEKNILDILMDAFDIKDIKTVFKVLGRFGTLLMPALPFLLGATSVVAFGIAMYKMFTNKDAYEAPDSDVNKGLAQAEKVGGYAGVQDAEEKMKKLPEYDQIMAQIKNYETTYNEGMPLNDKQLSGYEKKSAAAKKAVDDYKKERDSKSYTPVPTPSTAVNTAGQTGMAGLDETATAGTASPAPADAAPSPGEKLNNVVAENNNAKIEQMTEPPEVNTINNTVASGSKKESEIAPKLELPSVRNQEETFKRMIFYSTIVV